MICQWVYRVAIMNNNVMEVDVAIIGAGPAGLAAATVLRQRGVQRVVVLDREEQGGGVPRHCGHPPFGMREFYRVLTGPQYATRLVAKALEAGVKLLQRHSVTALLEGGELEVATPNGLLNVVAKRVLIATGIRETPRSARLISGARPLGITTTGAFQSMFYLKGLVPCTRPVIIGTELVAFSAVLTAASAGVKPVAMIEANSRISARHPCELLAHFRGVPLLLNTELESILGGAKVEGVSVKNTHTGESRSIDCDGVIFSGQFTPEVALGRMSHLRVDSASGGLQIDQVGRCSDPAYFAAGNVLRAVETAGWSYREGCSVGGWIADDLAFKSPVSVDREVVISCDDPIKFVVPQRIKLRQLKGFKHLQVRMNRAVHGELVVASDTEVLWRKKLSTLPERRILIPVGKLGDISALTSLRITVRE